MKSARFVLAAFIIILSHILMSSAQQGQGGWGGGGNGASAGTWSSASGQPGSNGNGQTSYSYGGIDANGVPYGGYGGNGGNGGYHINTTDGHGRQHYYSGGQGGYGGATGHPGQPGQPENTGTYSYANTNTYRNGKPNSSSSAYAAAWSTFYIICLFSLFLVLKS